MENDPKRPDSEYGDDEGEPMPYAEEYDAWFTSLTPEQQQAVLARDKRLYGGDDDEE